MTEQQSPASPSLTFETWPYSQDHLLFLNHFLIPTTLAAVLAGSDTDWAAALEADPLVVSQTFLAQGLLRQTSPEEAYEAVAEELHSHTGAQLTALLRSRNVPIPPLALKNDLIRLLIHSDPDHYRRRILEASHLQCTEPAVALVRRYLGQSFPEIEKNSNLTRLQLRSSLQRIKDQAVEGIIGNAAWAALLATIAAAAALARESQERPFTPTPAPTHRLPFEPQLIHIPAGPFLMGTSDAQVQDLARGSGWAYKRKEEGWFRREQPQHKVILPAFEIGRYPVTHTEYGSFLRATGHPPPSHWDNVGLFGWWDHPVTNVSWHDAQAYCAWLRERTGRHYRLPSEAEWEKAARGTDARLWPWGNEWDPRRCNCREGGPGHTTSVGQYSPAGDSPYGCADMAGNVEEWTRDPWRHYAAEPDHTPAYSPQDGLTIMRVNQVVRGGSFKDPLVCARCAHRDWFDWYVEGWDVGFRVVVVPVASGLWPSGLSNSEPPIRVNSNA